MTNLSGEIILRFAHSDFCSNVANIFVQGGKITQNSIQAVLLWGYNIYYYRIKYCDTLISQL